SPSPAIGCAASCLLRSWSELRRPGGWPRITFSAAGGSGGMICGAFRHGVVTGGREPPAHSCLGCRARESNREVTQLIPLHERVEVAPRFMRERHPGVEERSYERVGLEHRKVRPRASVRTVAEAQPGSI